MNDNLKIIFLVALALMVMQGIGGFFQIKGYRKAIHRMHKYGSLGIGQKRGRFFNGYIVIIACDRDHVITACEIMDGATILARFHPKEKLLGETLKGQTVEGLLDMLRGLDEKQQKRQHGYIQALEALEMRFNKESEEGESETEAVESSAAEN
ncbi:transcriptional regulator GutM [Catenisphaera adipataccumulans]|jgi:glucitol operon activator protein|uniref:DNA-binding transcriptional regulator of glucitol operon n=1 Tax=Catenisphaera adipataccumulans TaxID=700500 RepID=A0A7W8FXK1_9FIRM|nr:transcriptional regulator GutM [Catenisphaera adipataccumulans]MBB5183037.1 DNA-binding transcriptional regulator of glucitol operon [Catenisphaera adipataccumulans]